MNAIDTTTYKGYNIELHYDDDNCNNPLEDCAEVITLHYSSNHYILGTENHEERPSEEDFDKNKFYVFPYFAYIHSGTALSMAPFGCWWDSGQADLIITIDKAEFKDEKKAFEFAKSKLKTFNQYLEGEVYGYVIAETGDSCWGFYDTGEAMKSAKEEIDYIVEQARQNHLNEVKVWIRNSVPLRHRKNRA